MCTHRQVTRVISRVLSQTRKFRVKDRRVALEQSRISRGTSIFRLRPGTLNHTDTPQSRILHNGHRLSYGSESDYIIVLFFLKIFMEYQLVPGPRRSTRDTLRTPLAQYSPPFVGERIRFGPLTSCHNYLWSWHFCPTPPPEPMLLPIAATFCSRGIPPRARPPLRRSGMHPRSPPIRFLCLPYRPLP